MNDEEDQLELGEDIDMSHYTDKMWFDEVRIYLTDVFGMNDSEISFHMEKYFPDLFETQKESLGLLL